MDKKGVFHGVILYNKTDFAE